MEEHTKTTDLVLVVEDDEEIRELLRMQLEMEGFAVLTVTNGAEAINAARGQKPDIILMDIKMPVMNGVEATRTIKNDPDIQHIPILMVTVLETKDDVIQGLEAGAIDYITKPFFVPELKARVKAVLRFKKIYDRLTFLQNQLIKEDMLNTIREVTDNIQEAIDDNVAMILKASDYIRQEHGTDLNNDLFRVEEAAISIKNTVSNLGFLESFTFKLYDNVSDIVQLTS
jgi:DNA-binding response OmpR family regulator